MRVLIATVLVLTSAPVVSQPHSSIKQFAEDRGFKALSPPQVPDSETNMWRPGTIIYFDRDRRQIRPIPACSQLFTAPITTQRVDFAESGVSEFRWNPDFNIAIGLLEKFTGQVTGSAQFGFNRDRHLQVAYSALSQIAATEEDVFRQVAAERARDGGVNSSCMEMLRTPRFNSSNRENSLRFRFPTFMVLSVGIADELLIGLTETAKTELGADFTIGDAVSLKPSFSNSSSSVDQIKITDTGTPIVWGYRVVPLREIYKLGDISAGQGDRYRVVSDVSSIESDQLLNELSEARAEFAIN